MTAILMKMENFNDIFMQNIIYYFFPFPSYLYAQVTDYGIRAFLGVGEIKVYESFRFHHFFDVDTYALSSVAFH